MIRHAGFRDGEYQFYPRSAGFPIFQYEFSLVIFHDLLNYGETQTGALRTCRDIRLGLSLATLARQALPVVLNDHRGLAPHIAYR